jgi:hypothetical protein
MRHTFTSREIAHVWVHDNNYIGHGKCPGNASFHGDIFYSYGTAIAEKVTIKGREVMLVNGDNYSVSTSKVQGQLRYAIEGEYIEVRGISQGSSSLFNSYNPKKWARDHVKGCLRRAGAAGASAKRRKKEWLRASDIAEASQWLNTARDIRDLIDKRISVPEDIEDVTKYAEKARKVEAKRAKARALKVEKDAAEKVQAWLDGESIYFPHAVQRVHLRLVDNGETIETSKGASVPYKEGERAFRFALARRAKGWKRNGEQFAIGRYQLDSISDKGVVAGCHRFDWDTVTAFAKQNNWI